MKKIFLNKDGDLKAGWVAIITLSIIAFVVIILGITALHRDKKLEERANYKAFCDSIGGSFGEMDCYKDGKVIKNE